MSDSRQCPSCGYQNAPGAATCTRCQAAFDEADAPVHPGETFHDPDDLSLPEPTPAIPDAPLPLHDSPLLRAVVRGDSDAVSALQPPRPASPPPVELRSPSLPVDAPPRPTIPPIDQAAMLRDLAERLQTRKAEEPAVRYAGFFVRLVAFLIDTIVLAAFAVPLAAAGYFGLRAGLMVLGKTTAIAADESLYTFLTAAWFAMAASYFTVLHRDYGQTIGKSLLGLRVRALDLAPVGTIRSLIRTLAYAASSSFFGFGFLLVAFTPRKRGWHDIIAGTCVVRLSRDGASA